MWLQRMDSLQLPVVKDLIYPLTNSDKSKDV